MAEYYHYTLEKNIASIMQKGMYSNSHFYTNNQYYDSITAGQAVGVMPHNIDCVLLFQDDGKFRPYYQPVVAYSGRFSGGATQFEHPSNPRPVSKRKINSRTWTRI